LDRVLTSPRRLLAAGLMVLAAASPAWATITRNDAFAMAKAGKTPKAIIVAAFPGATIAQVPSKKIRVLIADLAPRMVFAGQTPLRVSDGGRRRSKKMGILPGHRIGVTRVKKGLRVVDLDNPANVHVMKGPVRIDAGNAPTGILMAEPLDRRFRGTLRVFAESTGRLAVVNELPSEDYIRGQLPGDMPPAWGDTAPNALVAGAIAARASALASVAKSDRSKSKYDVTSDDPLYLGLDGERAQTNTAIDSSPRWTAVMSKQPFAASFPVVVGDITIFVPDPGRPDPVANAPTRAVPGAHAGATAAAVALAMKFLGTPYVWGGAKPGGFDCSGLVYYVFGQQGVKLPRVAEDQARVGTYVPQSQLQPGDAVFFADSSGYIHHMGLYIGGGKMIHAPQTGDVVKITDITTGYYASQYAGARRYSG
jgi:cell wall-associated NlpC family hydrolase